MEEELTPETIGDLIAELGITQLKAGQVFADHYVKLHGKRLEISQPAGVERNSARKAMIRLSENDAMRRKLTLQQQHEALQTEHRRISPEKAPTLPAKAVAAAIPVTVAPQPSKAVVAAATPVTAVPTLDLSGMTPRQKLAALTKQQLERSAAEQKEKNKVLFAHK